MGPAMAYAASGFTVARGGTACYLLGAGAKPEVWHRLVKVSYMKGLVTITRHGDVSDRARCDMPVDCVLWV